jgi:hypothetical protein
MTTTTRRQGKPPDVVASPEVRGRAAGAGTKRRSPPAGQRPAGGRGQPADAARRTAGGAPQATAAGAPTPSGGRRQAAQPQAGRWQSRHAAAQVPEQIRGSRQATEAPAPPRRSRPRRPPVPGYRAGPGRARTAGAPDTRPAPATRAAAGSVRAPRRPPFVFLVVGLLSGGLVCLLLLNTVLAAGSFQMTSLQQANAALARQQQELRQQIAYSQSPSAIAQRARKLGMVLVSQPRFLNLKSGHVYGQAPGLVTRTGN